LSPTAVALGNFDGVHQGHRQVIQPILKWSAPQGSIIRSVVTFNPHPREFFSGERRSLLTPLEEKAAQLAELGIEQLVLLPFDRELASLSPEQFVAQILIDGLKAQHICVGQDFCFGKGRTGTANDLQAIAATHGVTVEIATLKQWGDTRISSSAIRQCLLEGDAPSANTLLGRPYSLVGEVVQGQQVGRILGFPTANLQLPPEKFLPGLGVYAVRVQLCDRQSGQLQCESAQIPGVMNLGHRPTVDGTRLIPEIHLFDWTGNLYNQVIAVHLEQFIRKEQKFDSLEALKAQIDQDCTKARTILGLG
jgi:riboflavin kinase/FMN adenylyltransferase